MRSLMKMTDSTVPEHAMQGSVRPTQAYRNAAAISRFSGFTLIELVVVISIIGIIAAVAYPSYLEHTSKARRSDATSSLMDVVNRQEQYLLDHKQYAANMTLLGYAANPYITPEGQYSVAVVNTGCGVSPCYRFTATPVSGKPQAKDLKCTSFSIDSSGSKKATGATPDKCW
ncbi:MAG: type IV pilin protein [Gammaproteobacteria bacterium]